MDKLKLEYVSNDSGTKIMGWDVGNGTHDYLATMLLITLPVNNRMSFISCGKMYPEAKKNVYRLFPTK